MNIGVQNINLHGVDLNNMCDHTPTVDIRYNHLGCTKCGKVFATNLQVFEAAKLPFYKLGGRFYDFK